MMLPSTAAARAIPRGLGDVLDPAAQSKTLDCGLFSGGVFKRACWCLDWPGLCTTEEYQAAVALAYPEAVYAPIQQPPAAPAVSAGTATTPAPYACEPGDVTNPNCPEYDAAVTAALKQQAEAWQAQNRETIEQTAANLDRLAQKHAVESVSTWLLLGAVGLGALVLLQDRRR